MKDFSKLIERQNLRAITAGLPGTLTLIEWEAAVTAFGERCAYCGGPYTLIEHFVPVCLGGGTARDNCVPACWSCNRRKANRSPFAGCEIDPAKIEAVRLYLGVAPGPPQAASPARPPGAPRTRAPNPDRGCIQFSFTYADLSRILGVSVKTIQNEASRGVFNPHDLESTINYLSAARPPLGRRPKVPRRA